MQQESLFPPTFLQMVGKVAVSVVHLQDILLKLHLLQGKLMSELNVLARDFDVAAIVIMEVANNDFVTLHTPIIEI